MMIKEAGALIIATVLRSSSHIAACRASALTCRIRSHCTVCFTATKFHILRNSLHGIFKFQTMKPFTRNAEVHFDCIFYMQMLKLNITSCNVFFNDIPHNYAFNSTANMDSRDTHIEIFDVQTDIQCTIIILLHL